MAHICIIECASESSIHYVAGKHPDDGCAEAGQRWIKRVWVSSPANDQEKQS